MPTQPKLRVQTYIGIDPGKAGGICLIQGGEMTTLPMPETERDIVDALDSVTSDAVAVIEHVTASPQMGVVSAFTFGGGYYGLRMALTALQIPFQCVRPQVWQRAIGVTPKKKTETTRQWKNRLRAKAQQLFPDLSLWNQPRSKGLQLAVADAILIAYYCRSVNR